MTAHVRIASGDLAGLDALEVDAVALHLYAERCQPRAVAGYVDWRLCGRLARLFLSRRFTGAAKDTLLMPAMGRIGAERIFLFGLGSRKTPRAPEARYTAGVLADAQARKVAVAGPDVDFLIAWLEAAGDLDFEEILLLEAEWDFEGRRGQLKEAAEGAGLSWGTP